MKGSCCSFVDKEEVNCNFRVDDVQNEVTRERERNLTNPIKPVLVTSVFIIIAATANM